MTGDLYINNYDAYTTWGISLEDGALSALMTPAPMKSYIETESRLQHGKVVVDTVNTAKLAARDITLPFHLTAKSKTEFYTRYNAFCNDVLSDGKFTLTTRFQSGVKYRLVYTSCNQFTQFAECMATFVLKVVEPDPTNRAV